MLSSRVSRAGWRVQKWSQWLWLSGLGLAAYLVPISASGAWLLLAPAAIAVGYGAGRRVASLSAGVTALCLGGALAAISLVFSAHLSVLGFVLNLLTAVVLFVLLPWFIGRSRRISVEFRQQEREHLVIQAGLRERSRLAGQMHDQLGHDLALLALQASVLQVSVAKDSPAHAQAAKIREQADASVDNLHRIIGVLNDPQAAAPLSPGTAVPGILGPIGLAPLEIIERAESQGMSLVCIDEQGLLAQAATSSWGPLLTVVIQEALTNAAKYAPDSAVRITMAGDLQRVSLEISTDLPDPAPARRSGATGLASLRDRLEAQGGQLQASPSAGRFTVHAEIPRSAAPVALASVPATATRRPRRWLAVLIPAVIVLAFCFGLYQLQAATYRATGLSPASFSQLSIGMDREQVEAIATAKGLDEPLPIIDAPPAPAGAQCRYYAARNGPLDLGSDMFRLCFSEGTLVAMDHLYPLD